MLRRPHQISPAMLLLALTLSGCASASSRVTDEVKSASSWAASVKMVIEQWLKEAIPSAFAAQALTRARTELSDGADRLRDIAADNAAAVHAMDLMADLQTAVDEASNALAAVDRARVKAELEQLVLATQRLDREFRVNVQ
jgi:hypothetical protein